MCEFRPVGVEVKGGLWEGEVVGPTDTGLRE